MLRNTIIIERPPSQALRIQQTEGGTWEDGTEIARTPKKGLIIPLSGEISRNSNLQTKLAKTNTQMNEKAQKTNRENNKH
jgi:hypothetical protein